MPWPNVSAAELRARGSLETFSLAVWRWKNSLPAVKRCAYGHHLRRRGVFISWRLFPAFRRLWGLHGPVDQVLESDRLNPIERHVLQVVAIQGPIRSRDLRREVQELSGASKRHYQAAVRTLQERFLITVAGGSVEGFTMHDWDLVERHAPLEALAATLPEDAARAQLTLQAVRECALLHGARDCATLWMGEKLGCNVAWGACRKGHACHDQGGRTEGHELPRCKLTDGEFSACPRRRGQ